MTQPAISAWILPAEQMPVSAPSAGHLRLARIESWLSGLGYPPATPGPRPRARRPLAPGRRGTWRALAGALGRLAGAPLLAGLALRRRPAVVVANTALNAPAVALIKLLLGRRVLVLVDLMGLRSLEVDQTARAAPARALYRPLWRGLERLLLRRADVVLTVNERHVELIRLLHGRDDAHALRDAAEAGLEHTQPADRSALGVPAGAVAVCFVGSLVSSRLDGIMDAWDELAHDPGGDGTFRACLVVVGDGPDLRDCRRRAAARGWPAGSAIFLGGLPRERALAVARACDIAVSDCWSEAGLPFKLYEYMALGMPIVTEGKPQIGELLTADETALFFHDPLELARHVRRLAGDVDLRARLGGGARRAFLAEHTLEARRREFEELLGPVLASVGPER
jgi:glycosyltransferase involved in cell wall biosynthesis